MAADGHTYSSKDIEEWFRTRQTSPCTGEALANKRLRPNHAIRSAVSELRLSMFNEIVQVCRTLRSPEERQQFGGDDKQILSIVN